MKYTKKGQTFISIRGGHRFDPGMGHSLSVAQLVEQWTVTVIVNDVLKITEFYSVKSVCRLFDSGQGESPH